MKKFVLPLTLLASITGLTSCATKTNTPTSDAPTATQVTVETLPPVVARTPDTVTPPTIPLVEDNQAAPVTRTEIVTYKTPAGEDPVEFSLSVLGDGTVTSVTVTPKAVNEISTKLQTSFAGEIASKIVGKKISELSLSAV